MLVVFDTNVLVSALLFEDSTPARAFFFALDKGDVLSSSALITEIHNVLYRPKFDKYLTDSQREDFMFALVESGLLIDITESVDICRDPKDNMILELAISGKADMIVTGDSDLLVLNPFKEIAIVDSQRFISTHSL
ncbi:MAG: putative toxin-antitoxin system toxin component, PIN family [Chloroflexi bacterium]|nr:putative toxin-antitoxin system toxin component, PIN family [Chloroflexota bacterium]MBI3169872.1 putative toxin-antitoxin system toxin component, PIN family [Chloroflexota bacterium]